MKHFIRWLVLAWILSFFGADTIFIDFFSRLIPLTVDITSYYVTFGCIGILFGLFGKDD